MKKNIVYKASCALCGQIYIGETGRMFKTRIKEHISKQSSAIFQHHLKSHKANNIMSIFQWEILLSGFKSNSERLYAESILISKNLRNNLMNGCTGLPLLLL